MPSLARPRPASATAAPQLGVAPIDEQRHVFGQHVRVHLPLAAAQRSDEARRRELAQRQAPLRVLVRGNAARFRDAEQQRAFWDVFRGVEAADAVSCFSRRRRRRSHLPRFTHDASAVFARARRRESGRIRCCQQDAHLATGSSEQPLATAAAVAEHSQALPAMAFVAAAVLRRSSSLADASTHFCSYRINQNRSCFALRCGAAALQANDARAC